MALVTPDLVLPAPALTYCLWPRAREGAGRREVRVPCKHPLAKPILVLLVKQVLLCPIPPVCTQPCRCGLPLRQRREPGLARGQCYCPTIAAVLFQFNKELMRNNEVWVLSSAMCSGDRGVRGPGRAPGSKATVLQSLHSVVYRLWVRHALVPRGRQGTCGWRRCGAPGLSAAAASTGYWCKEMELFSPLDTQAGKPAWRGACPGRKPELHCSPHCGKAAGLFPFPVSGLGARASSLPRCWGSCPLTAPRWGPDQRAAPATPLGRKRTEHGVVKKYLLSKNRKSTLPARARLALPVSSTRGGGCSPGVALAPQAPAPQP